MVVWLDQFRVLNKKLKNLALSINISFDNNPDFAFKLLE